MCKLRVGFCNMETATTGEVSIAVRFRLIEQLEAEAEAEAEVEVEADGERESALDRDPEIPKTRGPYCRCLEPSVPLKSLEVLPMLKFSFVNRSSLTLASSSLLIAAVAVTVTVAVGSLPSSASAQELTLDTPSASDPTLKDVELDTDDDDANINAIASAEADAAQAVETSRGVRRAVSDPDGYAVTETDSEFLFLPARGKNSAQFSYTNRQTPRTIIDSSTGVDVRRETDSSTSDYDLHFVRNISSATYLSFDVGYSAASTKADDITLRSNGLKDVGVGLTGVNRMNGWNLIYGGQFAKSLGTAIRPSATGGQGNRFSGGTTANPFIAFETVSHTATWGVRADAHYAFGTTDDDGIYGGQSQSLGATAFYEVPIFPTARLGFSAGANRDSDFFRFDTSFNNYVAGAYSRISFKREADLILRAQARTRDDANSSTTETDLTIGVRKSL